MKHVISATDFSREWVEEILERAEHFIPVYRRGEVLKTGAGSKVLVVTLEPSTRTGGSFADAARLLGCTVERISDADSTSLVKGEPLGASVRMWAGQSNAILPIRTKLEGGARWSAEMLEMEGYGYLMAIQNAGDGSNQHPTQAILDMLTIKQKKGRLEDLTIGIVGDLRHSRTVHSLVLALRLFPNIRLVLVSSPQVKLQDWYIHGMEVTVSDSISDLVGCDIVYATRVQAERFGGHMMEYERVRGLYSITPEVMAMLGTEVLIMHPQPINGPDRDIDPRLWRHPQVIMDFQAKMGIPARMGLLSWSLAQRETSSFSSYQEPVIDIVSQRPASESLKAKEEADRRFMPIDDGTVIDHIPFGDGQRIWGFLNTNGKKESGGVRQLNVGLRTTRQKGGRKDTISLEGVFLSDEEMSTIGVLAPDVTINEIREGTIHKKKVRSVSTITTGQCPNADCVTRLDIEAAIHPRFHIVEDGGHGRLRCHYCERQSHRHEAFK